MAKSQENGTTILLGLKGFEVGTVAEGEGKMTVEVKTKHQLYRKIIIISLFTIMLAYRYRQDGIIMAEMNHAMVHTSETSRKWYNKKCVSGG